MSILVDLSTTPYNSINTIDEFNEEYKKSDHLYRLIEFIVLSFLNAKFVETPIKRRGSIDIKPYTLEFIFNADYRFNWIMDEYFTYKLSKCKHYVKSMLKHKTTDLTIEQNMSLFLNLQTLTPRNINTRVWLSEVDDRDRYLDNFRLLAFNIKYNRLDEFLFHMTTNMFVNKYNIMSVNCDEQTSGSVLANGNIGCFVVGLWVTGLIDTDTYLYMLQGFEYIFDNGTDNNSIMYAMNIFLTQTLIRIYKNRHTTIKVYAIPYVFDFTSSILTDRLNIIVDEINMCVKKLLEQLEFSSINLFHTNMDGSIGDIKVPLITLIRYTPINTGLLGHTFNLIIEGNSLNPKISIADFYENKAITTRCDDGTLKYRNTLLQRYYTANMSSEFLYKYDGKEYPNMLPIAPLNSSSIMSILQVYGHVGDDGYFQLFCEVTTDIKDGKPFFNIDPRFLLNNDKSVTRAKDFLSRIKKTQKRKKKITKITKKFVNTIKKRLGKPLLAISESSSSSLSSLSSSADPVTKISKKLKQQQQLAQQFALAVFSNAKKSDFEMIMNNPNFNCNLSLDDINPALIPHNLRNSKSFSTQIKKCIDQQNTPLLILVGRKFTETIIEMIIKLLDMNCVNINYINSVGDNALTILLESTNAILEELDSEDEEDGYDEEYKIILRKDYENHIFLASRLITEGIDVTYSNGTTPLEYALHFKSKELLENLLNKGVTPSSTKQQDIINKILDTPPASERIEEHDTTKGGSYALRISNPYILRPRRSHHRKLSRKI